LRRSTIITIVILLYLNANRNDTVTLQKYVKLRFVSHTTKHGIVKHNQLPTTNVAV